VPLFQEQLLRMAMIAAGFTGGEAEELRRAFGFKRSEKLMKDVEVKLRCGMEKKGIFALIAYASAYLKCHYLAAFTAAMLNNQPMGFYHPATLVKDAQRHGLRVRPIDVTRSDCPARWKKMAQTFLFASVCGTSRGCARNRGERSSASVISVRLARLII
jgi:error-prone DNA polymerase